MFRNKYYIISKNMFNEAAASIFTHMQLWVVTNF